MADKLRESHRQLSEFQCCHKYLMALFCRLSEGRRHFSSASIFKLTQCNGHFLSKPVFVLNQTHFHNLKFEIHYFVKSAHTGSGLAGEKQLRRHIAQCFPVKHRCVYFNNASVVVLVSPDGCELQTN